MADGVLTENQALPMVSDSDPGLRQAATWVISRHAAWGARFAQAVEARLRSPQFNEREAESLGAAIASFCGDANMRKSMAGSLGDGSLDASRQLFLLDSAEACSSKEFPGEWTAGLGKLLAHGDARVRVRAIGLLRARGVSALDADLRRLADNAAEPDDVRVAAQSALGSRHPKLAASDFQYLASRLAPKVDATAKLAAGQVIGRSEFDEAQLLDIAQRRLREADPLVLPNLLDAFRNGSTERVGLALIASLSAMESSLGTVGSQRVDQLVAKFPSSVQAEARPLVARIEAGRKSRLEKLVRLEPALSARGDVTKGKELFFGAKTGCSSCHTIGVVGGHVGPDLTSIGAIRSPHDLLEAIVLPSESFVPGHEVYRVRTAAEVYSGVLGKSSPDAIRLITGPGDEVRIPRKDIVKMGFAPVSLMPEGFDEVLSMKEMTDLIAYLRAQTSRAAAGM